MLRLIGGAGSPACVPAVLPVHRPQAGAFYLILASRAFWLLLTAVDTYAVRGAGSPACVPAVLPVHRPQAGALAPAEFLRAA